VLRSPRAHKDLGPILRNLMRRGNTEFLDRGIHVLYVALGMPIVPVDGHRPARLLPLTAAEAFRRKTTMSILWP
jgi:hypothetical protein